MAQDKQNENTDGRMCNAMLTSPIDSSVTCLLKYKGPSKEFGKRALKTLINKLRMRSCASVDISPPDPCYKVVYLGNVLTGWAKGENCIEKPLSTLWRNYTQSNRADVRMQLMVSGGGLRATTRDHGLTEYWANRISFCAAPSTFPRLFCWVYRHEGRRLRHELRCHAVLCSSASVARKLSVQLRSSLAQALAEFKRDKISRQNARLSLVNSCYENPSMPRRKILLSTGSQNYRPPLERSKSAPKLTMIEENIVEEEDDDDDVFDTKTVTTSPSRVHPSLRQLRHSDSTSVLLDKKFRSQKSDFPRRDLASRLPPLTSRNLNQYNNKSNTKPLDKRLLSVDEECPEDTPNSLKQQFTKRNYSLRKCKTRLSNRIPSNKDATTINKCDDTDDESETIDLSELTIELKDVTEENKKIIEELLAESINCNNIENKTNNNHHQDGNHHARAWLDSDEGSLSSGCESAGTAASDLESCTTHNENNCESLTANDLIEYLNSEVNLDNNSIDFQIGSTVLARVRSLERLSTSSCNNGVRSFQNYIPELDDVSLIPVGEISNDFSSLRIFKKKLENDKNESKENLDGSEGEEENASSCSDESGYVELLESTQDNNKTVELV